MLTKLQVRTSVQQYFDDPNAKRWTGPNLDQVISFVYDGLFGDILDTASYWNSFYQQVNLPLRVPGYIDLKLTGDGGDLTKRFYRLQQCIADGRHYFAKDPRDYLMVASTFTGDVSTIRASTGVEQRFSYQFLGDQLWLHPLGNVTTFVELRYSYRPALFTSLADGANVEFPDGTEHVLILLSAAHAMTKGGVEDPGGLMKLGLDAKQRMLDSIRRRYHGPTIPFAPSNQWEWGGI